MGRREKERKKERESEREKDEEKKKEESGKKTVYLILTQMVMENCKKINSIYREQY